MPGVKRKASTAPGEKLPVKLKKQSTSVTLDRAIPTQTQKTAKLKKSTFSKISESPNVPKKIAGGLKAKNSLPTLPRFPTLVPTKPAGATGSDFVFNISPASSPQKDNSSDIGVSTSDVPGMRKETTTLIQTNSSDDWSGNKASNIEKSVLRLSSGSYVGRIMNKDVDDQMLPSLESLAVYDQKGKEKTSAAPFTWDMTDTDVSPVRKSVYDVNAVLHILDQDNSPTKHSLGGNTSDNDSDAPPVLQAEVYDATSCEDFDDDATVPTLTCMGTPSKSPCKSPRKMTGGPREIVFSFDTTGSMYNYMEEAGYRMRELMNRVQQDMPGIRLAFVAHGDYYDLANDRYLIKWIDFGASVDEVDTFFENLPITHGGDADECYELVLRKVRESLSWSPGSQRSLVMIGDSDPHEPGYKFNDFVNDIDWRQETKQLNEMAVRIYALQVGYTSNFYKQISQMTGGAHLRIENKDFTYETLMSICLREGGLRHLKGFEHEVRTAAKKSGSNGGTLDLELERLFSSLKNIADNKSLKQRERENKLKARILEMTTDSKALSATKRPSENEASTSDVKKPKSTSKALTKVPSEKYKSSGSLSPKKLTKIKEKGVDKVKKASVEKVKKISKIKTPATKLMKPKPKTKKLKEKIVEKKKLSQKTNSTEKKKSSGKLKKVASDNKPKRSVGRPRKIVESAKPRGRGRPPKKLGTSKLKEISPKKKEKSKVIGKPLKKLASKPRGRPRKTPEAPKKRGRPVKKVEKTKSPGRPSKAKTPKAVGKANKKMESTKSNITTKKKEETLLKSPSSVVQRIVAAKLKRLGKMGATSKVKIPKKVQTAVKTKDKKSKIKSKAIAKTKVSAKSKKKAVANKKLSSSKDSSKRKAVSAKLSLKKKEGKAKIAKLKAAKKIQDKKKAGGKGLVKEKKKPVSKVIKPTKSSKTAKKNVPKNKPGRPSNVQQKQKTKATNKPVKKETKKLGMSAANKGKKTPVKAVPAKKTPVKAVPAKKTPVKAVPAKKTPVKAVPAKKTPAKPDIKKMKSSPEKKNSVKPKSPQKNKTSKTEQRENISGSKFSTGPLSNVKWSQWTSIISPKSNGADWSKSRSWCGGHSNEALYQGEGFTQALYEAAVVPPGSNSKYVVTYVVGHGVPAVRAWDCFTSQQVRQQVQRIVKAKGTICVRRGVIAGRAKDSLIKAEEYIKENFDYAWRGSRRKTEVRKEGFLVSKP
ncbi:hypothetical protein KP79_PYT11285 [Mizuhopecten yessoensis]|uniref:VWFA domain-containing protein n=1 Tax=Mizuhopecten yessoensis TaxID=6573 RepID=A0A210Q936_MIZYE|nr:hypothetical protein KP79_PYT11285 [Mizuhopecten yessoensis]